MLSRKLLDLLSHKSYIHGLSKVSINCLSPRIHFSSYSDPSAFYSSFREKDTLEKRILSGEMDQFSSGLYFCIRPLSPVHTFNLRGYQMNTLEHTFYFRPLYYSTGEWNSPHFEVNYSKLEQSLNDSKQKDQVYNGGCRCLVAI